MKNFAVYSTLFGFYRIEYEDNAVTSLKRLEEAVDTGIKTPLTELVYTQLTEYFGGRRQSFDFPYRLQGTEFQKKVWTALCNIPYGETRTYKEIAQAVGNPQASRAVGMANNKNPISIAVPCHRVIGSNGKLVGYAGGLDVKKALLELESKVQNAADSL